MEKIQDDFNTQLGQINGIYQEGMQSCPEHSDLIANELLKIRSAIDNLIQGHKKSQLISISPIYNRDNFDPLLSPSGPSDQRMINQICILCSANLEADLFTTSIGPSSMIDDQVDSNILPLEHINSDISVFSDPGAAPLPDWSDVGNSSFVYSDYLQATSHSGPSRKRTNRQISTDDSNGPNEVVVLQNQPIPPFRFSDPIRASIVQQIYHEVGGFRAISQLRILLREMREHDGWHCNWQSSQLSGIIGTLDRIDELHCTTAFLCRLLLLRLWHLKESLLLIIRNKEHYCPGASAEVLVLDEMICLAYPTQIEEPQEDHKKEWRKKYADKRKALKNRLTKARSWQSAVDVFDLGILALFPSGKDGEIRNYRFEKLPGSYRQFLLHSLQEKDDRHVETAASNLKLFVQAVYEGQIYNKKLQIEEFDEAELKGMDIKTALALCKEVSVGTRTPATAS